MSVPSVQPSPPPQVPAGPRLSELAGMAEARTWGEALAKDIDLFRCRMIAWTDVDPGCLLFGPPGTGKTTFAKALATSCRLPLVTATFGEWQSSDDGHLGSTLAAMRGTFARAIKHAPCILFIDELDSIPRRAGSGRNAQYWTALTNELLKEFDALTAKTGVVVVGACNHPELLDPALVRSGRMDRMIGIRLPNAKELESVILFHLHDYERPEFEHVGYGPTLELAAIMSTGMSGADVAKAVRIARRHARHAREPLAVAHYLAAVQEETNAIDEATLRRTAVHEAGHAVAALRLRVSKDVTVSIVRRGNSLGSVRLDCAAHLTPEVHMRLIMVLLAGRAAEEVLLGSVSSLAGGDDPSCDLARATALASDGLLRLGFSPATGLVWAARQSMATELASAPVKALIDDCYQRVLTLVRHEEPFVKRVASALEAARALSHGDILALDRLPAAPAAGRPSPAIRTAHQPTRRPRLPQYAAPTDTIPPTHLRLPRR